MVTGRSSPRGKVSVTRCRSLAHYEQRVVQSLSIFAISARSPAWSRIDGSRNRRDCGRALVSVRPEPYYWWFTNGVLGTALRSRPPKVTLPERSAIFQLRKPIVYHSPACHASLGGGQVGVRVPRASNRKSLIDRGACLAGPAPASSRQRPGASEPPATGPRPAAQSARRASQIPRTRNIS